MKNLLAAVLLSPLLLFSQEGFKAGKIDPDLVKMNTCPIDSSAGAFYLLEYGETRIDHSLEVELYHVVRIKILDKSELDRGDVTIPYTTGKTVRGLKAYTYNIENGQLVTTALDKKAVFKEKVDENTSNLKFSLPNVREGSVIEYSYRVNYGSYRSLNTWYFQTGIPVLKSEYQISIPEYFDYYRNMTGYVGLVKADISNKNGRFGDIPLNHKEHHYIAVNVPAFKDEKFIRSKSDVISKINFILRSVIVPGVLNENYLFRSYGGLANKMMENSYWSKDLERAPWAKEVLATLKKGSNLEDAKSIFAHVQSFEKAYTSSSSLRYAFKNKKGTDTELNRLLIALLREAGFEVFPVMVRTRNRGKLDPYNALRDNFNFTIAKAIIDDKEYLLDASEPENIFGVLPRYCLNGKGLVVRTGPEEWVALEPYKKNIKMTSSSLELTEDGMLIGEMKVKRKGYLAWDFQDDLEEDGIDKYIEDFSKSKENWIIEDHSIKEDDSYSVSQSISAEVEGNVEDLGSVIYLNPLVFSKNEENPFKRSERIYPIDFGVPYTEITYTEIRLPEGMVVESLPEKSTVGLPNGAGMLLFSATQVDNKIVINQRVKIDRVSFSPDEYPLLREFFARLSEKGGEQIVLKRS